MPNNNNQMFDGLISRTKIYLVVIAIILIIFCIFEPRAIIPSIVFYLLVLGYTYWSNRKRKSEISEDLKNLTLNVNQTAKSTLINSPFPVIIIETNGNVVWKSKKFVNEFANIDINNYLNEIVKELKIKIESAEDEKKDKTKGSIETNVEIGDKIYQVTGQYIKTKDQEHKKENNYMSTLYFIDRTELSKLKKENEDLNLCVGIVMIDNYEEIMQRLTAEDKTQLMANIEKEIYQWGSNYNGLAIKTERDSFFVIIEQKYLNQIEDEKFNILDIVKEIKLPSKIQATLSIAVSNDGENNYEKYKSAQAVLDIALGRGGDQAITKNYDKYNFFGGRTEELEKRTRVKARIVAGALEELMMESEKVMVMGHVNGDMDSIGSSFGIFRMAKTLGKEAYIVNNGMGMGLEGFIKNAKKQEDYKGAIIEGKQALDLVTKDTLLVIVDTHKKNYVDVPELLEETEKVVIIDHHRRSTDYIQNAILTFHEVYASSAAELVTELIEYCQSEVELNTMEIEGLYAGIMMDTKNFTFKTGVRTFEAAAYLRKCGVDIIRVKKWFQSDLESYNVIADIVAKAEIVNDTIAISIYEKEDENANVIAAKAADELLTISNITASFVIGNLGNKISISGRSIGDINVQMILEKFGGGGHITLAGAQVEDMTLEETKQELVNRINEYFYENEA